MSKLKQKLILPINKAKITASFKNRSYFDRFGFTHYGTDMVSVDGASGRSVYASGTGQVAAAGWDYNAGYTVVIIYPQAYNHKSCKYQDIAVRYYHLDEIAPSIKEGAKVNKDTVFGKYGGSGKGSMTQWAKHLHIEVDTDTTDPNYSPTFIGSGSIIKGTSSGATATTVQNPLYYLHIKNTAPDHQTYITAADRYINTADYYIPKL